MCPQMIEEEEEEEEEEEGLTSEGTKEKRKRNV